jgi:hypothetical protein
MKFAQKLLLEDLRVRVNKISEGRPLLPELARAVFDCMALYYLIHIDPNDEDRNRTRGQKQRYEHYVLCKCSFKAPGVKNA